AISSLARTLGVTSGAVSQWGRTRPIPRHARARLEQYLQSPCGQDPEPNREPTAKTSRGSFEASDACAWLSHFLVTRPSSPPAIVSLPPRYRRRLRERVDQIQTRLRSELERLKDQVERELSEYERLLRAESGSKKRHSGS